jgi:adhesin/invasin
VVSSGGIFHGGITLKNVGFWLVLGAVVLAGCTCGGPESVEEISETHSTVEVDRTSGLRADGEDRVTIIFNIRNGNGAPVAGAVPTLAVTGSGNVVSELAPTDASGESRITLRSTVAEVKVIDAGVIRERTNLLLRQDIPVTFEATEAARLSFLVPPSSAQAGELLVPAVKVRVEDAQGNPITSATSQVTLSIESGPDGAALEGTVTAAAVDGTATFADLRIAVSGADYRLRATADALAPAISPAFEISRGAPASLRIVSQPVQGTAGEAFTVTVGFQDASGNLLPDATGTIALALGANPAAGTLGGTLSAAAVNGVATFGDLSIQKAAVGYTVAATSAGFVGAESAAFSIFPAAPNQMTSTLEVAPQNVVADGAESTTATVTVRDAYANTVPDVPVALTVTGGGNTLTPAQGATAGDGQFTSTLVSTQAETKTVEAAAAGFTLSTTVVFVPGAVDGTQSTFGATPAQAVADGANAINLEVFVRDAQGNPIAGAAVSLASNGTNDTFTPASGASDAAGRFGATLTSTRAEQKTVTASLGAVSLTAQVTFVAGPADAAQSALTATPASATADGAATVALLITVRDAFGNPVPSEPVVFTTDGANDAFSPTATGSTDVDGELAVDLSSTTAEQKTVTASFAGGGVSTQVTFVAGPASSTTSTFTANPTTVVADGASPSALLVTLRDAQGNRVGGEPVSFSSSDPTDTFAPGSGTSSAAGEVASSVTSTTAGTRTLVATFATGALSTVVTFEAGAPTSATSTVSASPTSFAAGDSSTVTVTLRDANGNLVPGAAVSLSASGSANTFSPASGTTDGSGVFTSTFGATTAEQKTVTATFAGGTVTTSVTVTPAAPSSTTSTLSASPTAVTADGTAATTLTATVRDAYGNLVPGVAVSFTSTGTGNTFTPASGTTGATGVATSAMRSTVAESKTVTASFSGGSASTAVLFTAGAPVSATSTVSASPTSFAAGGSSTVTVTLRDANGNLVPGAAVSLSASGSANTFTPAAGSTDASGVFTSAFGSTMAEQKTITATFTGGTVTTSVTVTPAAPSSTTSTLSASPTTVTADGTAATTLTATVRDVHGNLVPGVAVTFTSTGTGNTFTPASSTTSASGVASSAMRSTVAESKTVTASFSGGSASTAVTFTAGAAVSATSTLSASPTSFAAGDSSTVTVTLRDANGNLVSGATVVFSSTGTGNSFTPASGTTDGSGVLTSSFSSTTAEAKTLTATFGAESVTTAVTIAAGAPDSANSTLTASASTVVAGDGTTLTLTVRDGFGNPVPNQPVGFSSTGTSNTFSPATGTTSSTGVLTSIYSSTIAEAKTVTASFSSQVLTVAVTFTPGAPSASQSTLTAAPSTVVAGDTTTLTATIRDAHGNLVAGETVTFASSGSANVFNPDPPSGTSSTSGQVTATLGSTTAEVKSLTAAVGGLFTLSSSVTFGPGPVDAAQSSVSVSPVGLPADGSSTTSISVTVRDAFGNTVPNQTVALAATGSGNTLVQPSGPSDATGLATGTLATTVSEVKVVTATVNPGAAEVVLLDQPEVDFIAPLPTANVSPVLVSGSLSCSSSNSNNVRRVAIDAANYIYVVMVCSGEAHVVVSRDGGNTYTAPLSTGMSSLSLAAVHGHGQREAYLAGINSSSEVVFSRTTDGGATWSTPVTVGTASGTGYGISMGAFGNNVYLGVQGNTVRVFRNSTSGQGTWPSTDVSLSGSAFGAMVVDETNGDVWAMGNDPSLYLRQSTDGGATFGAQFNPAGSSYYSAWALGGGRIYSVGSTFGGVDHPASRILTSSPGTSTQVGGLVTSPTGQFRGMAADVNGNGYVISQTSAGSIQLQRLLATASSAESPRTVAASGSYPSVVAAGGGEAAFVAFSSGTSIRVGVEAF